MPKHCAHLVRREVLGLVDDDDIPRRDVLDLAGRDRDVVPVHDAERPLLGSVGHDHLVEETAAQRLVDAGRGPAPLPSGRQVGLEVVRLEPAEQVLDFLDEEVLGLWRRIDVAPEHPGGIVAVQDVGSAEQADCPFAEGQYFQLEVGMAGDLLAREFADVPLQRPVEGEHEDAHGVGEAEAFVTDEPCLAELAKAEQGGRRLAAARAAADQGEAGLGVGEDRELFGRGSNRREKSHGCLREVGARCAGLTCHQEYYPRCSGRRSV